MSRLIDADALISDLEYDVKMDEDSLIYEDLTSENREIIQFDKDCKQNAIDLLRHAPTIEERTPMQELLDVTADREYWKAQCHSYEMTINRLAESAQPERIKGRWIPADTQCGIKCSNCGYPVDDFCHSIDYIDLDYNPNFCPNCGAKMEVTT